MTSPEPVFSLDLPAMPKARTLHASMPLRRTDETSFTLAQSNRRVPMQRIDSTWLACGSTCELAADDRLVLSQLVADLDGFNIEDTTSLSRASGEHHRLLLDLAFCFARTERCSETNGGPRSTAENCPLPNFARHRIAWPGFGKVVAMTTLDDPHDASGDSYSVVSTPEDPYGEQQLIEQGMDPLEAQRLVDGIKNRHDDLPEPGQKFRFEYLMQHERLEASGDGSRDFPLEHPAVAAARNATHPIFEPSVTGDWITSLDWVCLGSGWHTNMDGVAIRSQREGAFVLAVTGATFGTNPDLTEAESIRLEVHGMVNGPLGLELPDLEEDESDHDLNDPHVAVQYQRDLEASERKVLVGVQRHGVEQLDVPLDGAPTPFRLLTYRDSWCARGEVAGAVVLMYGRAVDPADVTLTAADAEPFIEQYLVNLARDAESESDEEIDGWSDEEHSRDAHRPRRIRAQDIGGLVEFEPLRIVHPSMTGSLVGWSGDAGEVIKVKLGHRLEAIAGQVVVSTGTTIDPRSQVLQQQGLLFELPDEQETRLIQRLHLAAQESISIPVDGQAIEFAVVEWEDTFSAWAWTGRLGIELWGRGIDIRSLRLESVVDLSEFIGASS